MVQMPGSANLEARPVAMVRCLHALSHTAIVSEDRGGYDQQLTLLDGLLTGSAKVSRGLIPVGLASGDVGPHLHSSCHSTMPPLGVIFDLVAMWLS